MTSVLHRNHVSSFVCLLVLSLGLELVAHAQEREPRQQKRVELPDQTYMPVIGQDFEAIYEADRQQKPAIMNRQEQLLRERYDLSDNPSDTMMSAGRKPVQQGVRTKLPEGVAKYETGGQVFPSTQIDAIRRLEDRSLERFDVEFDLPQHLLPEFPPPIFLTSRTDLGNVSQGKVLSIDNYYDIMHGILTPVQMEGLRLLLTPFPQQQFNQTRLPGGEPSGARGARRSRPCGGHEPGLRCARAGARRAPGMVPGG